MGLFASVSFLQFYLADFGLVTLYRIDGRHKPEKANPRLRDNGTLEFCSRDAHAGTACFSLYSFCSAY